MAMMNLREKDEDKDNSMKIIFPTTTRIRTATTSQLDGSNKPSTIPEKSTTCVRSTTSEVEARTSLPSCHEGNTRSQVNPSNSMMASSLVTERTDITNIGGGSSSSYSGSRGGARYTQMVKASITSQSFNSMPYCVPATTKKSFCEADDKIIDEEMGRGSDLSVMPSSSCKQSSDTPTTFSLKENLLKVSNWASFLCVLDCTILPLITFVLPLFGIVAATPTQMEWLHHFGNLLAIFFVIPVGGVAISFNYFFSHQKKWITSIGYLGLILVAMANANTAIGCGRMGSCSLFGGYFLYLVSDGIGHRVANLSGCAFLMISNWLSRREHGRKLAKAVRQFANLDSSSDEDDAGYVSSWFTSSFICICCPPPIIAATTTTVSNAECRVLVTPSREVL